ncbi:MAG: glycosyltransferase family 9 protein [Thermodesulfobacteriota bacterium]
MKTEPSGHLNDIRDQKTDNGSAAGPQPPIRLPENPSFLIILMGSLGDVARGLVVVSQIKKKFPAASISWLVEPKCRELVTYHPLIDQVLFFNRTNWKQGGLKDIFRELRQRHFDCVLDLQRHFKSGLFSFLSGARYRIGFHPDDAKEGNWLFNNIHIPAQDKFYPKLFHYLKFTEYLECHPAYAPSQSRSLFESGALDFGFSGPGLSSLASEILSGITSPYAAVVLGSSWVSKEWPVEGYSRLIQEMITTTPWNIVMVDTKEKYPMACDLEKRVNSARLINLVGRTSILELAAVLKQAAIAVGPDCGSAHIAAAVGTPYVTIFGPTSPERTAPFGSEHLVVSANVPCAPCYKRKCPGKNMICMSAIQAEDVMRKIRQATPVHPTAGV